MRRVKKMTMIAFLVLVLVGPLVSSAVSFVPDTLTTTSQAKSVKYTKKKAMKKLEKWLKKKKKEYEYIDYKKNQQIFKKKYVFLVVITGPKHWYPEGYYAVDKYTGAITNITDEIDWSILGD